MTILEEETQGVSWGSTYFTSIVLVLGIILLATYLLYRWSTSHLGTFKKLGIVEAHAYPVIGSLLPTLKMGVMAADLASFEKYGRVYGTFEGSKPSVYVSDPDMVREILVKEFDNFTNRRPSEGFSKVITDGLSNARDAQWKRIRSTLSPSFSVSKLKHMLPLIEDCVESLLEHYNNVYDKSDDPDVKELYSCFSMDIISRTAFSTKLDSYRDLNSSVLVNAKRIFDFNPKFLIFLFFPKLNSLLSRCGLGIFAKEVEFFSKLIHNVLENRHEKDRESNDMLQHMLDSHEHIMKQHKALNKPGLTMDEVIAQSVLFMMVAYETTAQVLTMAVYYMALNPEIQERVCQEIDSVLDEHDGNVTYECLADMKYMDMVVNETMRMSPAALRTERQCSKDCIIKGTPIKAEWMIQFPIYVLHHDKQYWEEPERFNPERFAPENKANINPYAFLPFGMGPRQCVAMRLAQVEIKIALTKVLQKYKYEISEKMEMPITFKKGGFGSPAKPVYMKLIKR